MMDSITIRKFSQTRTIRGAEVIESMSGQRPMVIVERDCIDGDILRITAQGYDGAVRSISFDGIEAAYDLLYCLGTVIMEHEHCQRIGTRIVDGFVATLPDNTQRSLR